MEIMDINESEQWLPPGTPENVLGRLKDSSLPHADRRLAVIDAELVAFSADALPEVQNSLRAFIEQYCDSNDPQDLIAVGSAIRKYVATTNVDDLETIASLLDARHRSPVPLDIELEITKMVVRKLTANPPGEGNTHPALGRQLRQLASLYVSDRLLAREKYAAIALNAILALLLMRDAAVQSLLNQLSELHATWFKDLVIQRAGRLKGELTERFGTDACVRVVEDLDSIGSSLYLPQH
jgi:hypothetical protein